MKVRIVTRPTGYINGHEWPQRGEVIDLPEVVVESMGDALEVVKKVEKRPARNAKVEKRNVGTDAG